MNQYGINCVQCKMECLFKVRIVNEESSKNPGQQYSVYASHELNDKIDISDFSRNFIATEKFDGTCCFIDHEFHDITHGDCMIKAKLWARFDRKPNKQTEKRFKSHMRECKEDGVEEFKWGQIEEEFKPVPALWRASISSKYENGQLKPNKYGQIFGWNQVLCNESQPEYKWHILALDYQEHRILMLTPDSLQRNLLILQWQNLSDYVGKSLELVGTNINGNPYRLGNKKSPLVLYILHGSILVKEKFCKYSNSKNLTSQKYMDWFRSDDVNNKIEGIVWHGNKGGLVKLHRNHLQLKWPLSNDQLRIHSFRVKIKLDNPLPSNANSMIKNLYSQNGNSFNSILDIPMF